MKPPITKFPDSKSFLDLPTVSDWSKLNHNAVVFGAPFGKPYGMQDFPNNQSTAPDRLRDASPRILIDQYALDLDLESGSTLASISVVDGGNIPLRDNDIDQHYSEIEGAVRYLVDRGVLTVSIGGDDGITNPVLRGLDPLNDVTVIQIDAHMDWKNERFGERDGYSSPMRRASEMAHISGIHQVGIRSYGSATAQDLKDAKDWGAKIYLAKDIHKDGIELFLNELPEAGKFFITLDVDGLDPSIVPGTVALSPGGLDWMQVAACFEGISKKGQIIGLNVVELAPKNDINQISMIVVGRLILKCLMLELNK
ncbi:MAG: arginase [Rhodobacterales bacterium]|nr:arginase [Rhodobacterales bacterium]